MGAADVVPGVSGGTIAFISGIYEELLDSIASVNLAAIKTLRTEGFKAAWKHINGNFLVALFLGIFISILSLVKLISWLLENEPIGLWSFFFGLVVASVFFVGRTVSKWSFGPILALIIGTAVAYFITISPTGGGQGAYWYIFLSGMLAICAMILPGISGSFILVLLGSYTTILDAVDERDFTIISLAAAGAVAGLLLFSRILKWMFNKYQDLTIAAMTGFLIGSLNKIWPWRKALGKSVKHPGTPKEEIFITQDMSVLPADYVTTPMDSLDLNFTSADPEIMKAAMLGIAGLLVIGLLEIIAKKLKRA